MNYFYAQIRDGICIGLVQTPNLIIDASMIEIDTYDILKLGNTYANGTFTPPLVVLPNTITKLALLNRMTDAEFIGIITAAKTDAEIDLWKTRFDSTNTIDLDDGSRVVAGFPMLVTKGLLTQERATKILTDPIQASERS